MVEVEIKKWGNSFGIIIPKFILNDFDLKRGDRVDVEIVSKKRIDGFGMFKGAPPFQRENEDHEDLW